jgi:hypothetical protein
MEGETQATQARTQAQTQMQAQAPVKRKKGLGRGMDAIHEEEEEEDEEDEEDNEDAGATARSETAKKGMSSRAVRYSKTGSVSSDVDGSSTWVKNIHPTIDTSS